MRSFKVRERKGTYGSFFRALPFELNSWYRKVTEIYCIDLGSLCQHRNPLFLSDNGSMEFSKRFRTKQGWVDLSPISLKCCMNSQHPMDGDDGTSYDLSY